MSILRRIALWIAVNIPLGRLSPYLLGFGLNSKPKPDKNVPKR